MKFTPLHVKHLELKARMAPFAGYDMPISYDEKTGGMTKEHLAVREHVGMFDVCHMGEFWAEGKQATDFLNYACTRPFHKLADGKAQYCLLLNERGGIVDDIIIYKFTAEKYWIVVNASNIQKDFDHLERLSKKFEVRLKNVSEQTGLIAVQGPKAVSIVSKLLPGVENLKYYSFLQTANNWIVGRTGYTGEDGFEIFLPSTSALELWNDLEKQDVVPIGLGARDTLRLEVGFPLYGHELSDDLFPQETFSAFAVDQSADFYSSSFCKTNPRFVAVAIESQTPKPIRAEQSVSLDGKKIGVVTSGSTSPSRRVGIGLALLERVHLPNNGAFEGLLLATEGGAGRPQEVRITNTPFVETPRAKKRPRQC